MKAKIITLITLILMGGMNLYAQNRRTLIAYFSWSGNTQHVAEYIAGQTGGTLFRIDPVKPYPTDYKPCTEVAKKERNRMPALLSRTRWKIGTVMIQSLSVVLYGGGLHQ